MKKNALIQFKLTLMKKISALLDKEGAIVSHVNMTIVDVSTKDNTMARGEIKIRFQTEFDEDTFEKLKKFDDELFDESYLEGGVPNKTAKVKVMTDGEES